MIIDLTTLTWQQFALVTLAVTVARFAIAVVAGIRPPNTFDTTLLASVLETQILNRVVPISAIALLAQSFPAGSSAQIAIWAVATGGLALYVVETVQKGAANWAASNLAASTGDAVAKRAALIGPKTLPVQPKDAK